MNLVVAAHEGPDAGLDGALEWRIVHLKHSSIIQRVLAHGFSVYFLAVQHPVLGAGNDLLVLDALHQLLDEDIAQICAKWSEVRRPPTS